MEPRDRLVVVGKTGTGKSTYTKRLVAQLHRAGWRVVVFDPADEYSRSGRGGVHVVQGPLPSRLTMPELLKRPEVLDSPRLGLAVVSDGEPPSVAKDFRALATLCRHTGTLALVVEECGYFAEHCQESFKAVATLYRHQGISAVFVAQRATQIPLTARAQASKIVAFRQDEPADLAALSDKCGEEFSRVVAGLKVGQHATWTDSV